VVWIDLKSDGGREADAVLDRIEAWTKVVTNRDRTLISVQMPHAADPAEAREQLSADVDNLDVNWRDHFSFPVD
jgi:hypothetical protein